MDLVLEIEELRLNGFKRSDREKIAASLQLELSRLIAEEGLPPALKQGSDIRLEGGAFSLPSGLDAEKAGVQLARQMYGRWSQ